MANPARYIVGYLPATMLPAVMSFVAVYTFTRLLSPVEYGTYSLALSGILLAQAACFYSLQLGVGRFYAKADHEGTVEPFMATFYRIFFAVGLGAVVLFAGLRLVPWFPILRHALAPLAVVTFLFRSLVSVDQIVNRASNRVGRNNWVECTHSLLGFFIGLACVLYIDPTAQSVLYGLLGGALLASLIDRRYWSMAFSKVAFDREMFRRLLQFAGPLTFSYATAQLLQNADRFMIGDFNGAAAAGVYAVAINLVDRPVSLICNAITTATFQLAVQAMEREGPEAGGRQMVRNGEILVALVVPACVGVALASKPIASVLVGPDFREGVALLIPVVSAASLMRGVAVHFIEHAFHLSRRSDHMLGVYVVVTILNIGLNWTLLPRFGVMAAAWTAVGSQFLLLLLDFYVGQRNLKFHIHAGTIARIGLATLAMALVLLGFHFPNSWAGVGEMIGLGVLTYGLVAIGLDIVGARQFVLKRLRPAAA